jgi:hypothetical protein
LDLLKLKHLDFKRLNVATNADCCDPANVLGAIPQRVRNKPEARALCTAANYRCDAFLMLRSANCVSFRALHLKERPTLQTLGSEFSAQVARRHCAAAIGPIKHSLLAFPQSVFETPSAPASSRPTRRRHIQWHSVPAPCPTRSPGPQHCAVTRSSRSLRLDGCGDVDVGAAAARTDQTAVEACQLLLQIRIPGLERDQPARTANLLSVGVVPACAWKLD